MFNLLIRKDVTVAVFIIFLGIIISTLILFNGQKIAKADGDGDDFSDAITTYDEAYELCGNWGGYLETRDGDQTYKMESGACIASSKVTCKSQNDIPLWFVSKVTWKAGLMMCPGLLAE